MNFCSSGLCCHPKSVPHLSLRLSIRGFHPNLVKSWCRGAWQMWLLRKSGNLWVDPVQHGHLSRRPRLSPPLYPYPELIQLSVQGWLCLRQGIYPAPSTVPIEPKLCEIEIKVALFWPLLCKHRWSPLQCCSFVTHEDEAWRQWRRSLMYTDHAHPDWPATCIQILQTSVYVLSYQFILLKYLPSKKLS